MKNPSSTAAATSASDAREPIAIIGIGCRFPGGANDPNSFWRILEEGRDVISEVPEDRWSDRQFYDPQRGKPGKTQARWGGFIDDVSGFDSRFFGISPREAARMDPQQRMLLETAWEAIEDAGQALDRLSGSKTAVYVGISSWDYSYQVNSFRDRGVIDPYSNTGGSHSIAANRISYCFDLRGPSAAVDTACSSALLAVHLACQSIWNDDCPQALAGGVNALLLPDFFVAFSQLSMLSPDGRCKAFDARANGFVRSEGAGMVLLKPLDQALRDDDRIYAVIRGTASNQDGRTAGMTVPSQEAQQRVITKACCSADVSPANIQYVEAHGTGTLVGDPIEARALGQILGSGRPADQPCVVGSVKTNIGHLEAGAGAASLIKVALAMHHGRIPASLHFQTPNPEIDFDALRLRVPAACEPWPAADGPRLAGINSFGYGGTNAHVIVQEAPDTPHASRGPRCACESARLELAQLVPLSVRSSNAVPALARSMKNYVESSSADITLQDIASNAALRRTHHGHRIAVVAKSKEDLAGQLEALADGQPQPETIVDRAAIGQHPKIAFVCAGQGPQWWAMGRQLLETEPLFRDVMERCDAIVQQLGPWSLLEELTASEANSRMAETAISQPSIFALQVGLAAVWRSWGVEPSALVGHSVGEVAAAHLAGVYSLEDATRVIYQRGRCMDRASSRGRMLAAGLTLDEAREVVAEFGDYVSVAAVNSPSSVTLSGEPEPLEEIASKLDERQIFCRRLQVEYAFHSAQMDPIHDELLKALEGIRANPANRALFSAVTGRRVEGPELGPEYWWRNVRQMVRFAGAIQHMAATDCDLVVELGPHPVLTAAVTECYQQTGKNVCVVPSLRRKEDERATMLRSLGVLHTTGYAVDWAGVVLRPRRFLRLPRYPWQRERLWFESDECRKTRLQGPAHPLLGCTQNGPLPAWQNRLDVRLFTYLADHCVQGAVVFPAAAYVEMALASARDALGQTACQVEDLRLASPCVLSDDEAQWLETRFRAEDGGLTIHGQPIGSDDWDLHSRAVVRGASSSSPPDICPDEIKHRCNETFDRRQCYAYFEKLGLEYGPTFQGIVTAWRRDGESLAIVELPESLAQQADDYIFHPALLDACFQVVIPADEEFDTDIGPLYLPIEIEHVRLFGRPGPRVWVHARMLSKTRTRMLAELDIYNEDQTLVMQIRGFRSQRASGKSVDEQLQELLYRYQWQPQALAVADAAQNGEVNGQPASPGHWLLFADQAGVAVQLAAALEARGATCTLVSAGNAFADQAPSQFAVRPADRADMIRLTQAVLADHPVCQGIVHLWNLDAPSVDSLRTEQLEAAQDRGVQSLLHLVQAWDEVAGEPSTRLMIVTRGAQSVGEFPQKTEVAQSPVIGFGRVIVSEYPRLPCKLVDLDPAGAVDVSGLVDEVWAIDDEDEVAHRASTRYVHRYMPFSASPMVPSGGEVVPYRLTMDRPGTLDGLKLATLTRRPPAAGRVEIEVRAAALNFSDVMKALSLYPGMPYGPISLGAECSGVVTAVGASVDGLQVGDEVLAVASFAFGSHVVANAKLTARKPTELSFEDAATIPIAFLTASYALEDLARLDRGERVLIHAASGGVGLAAIQLARKAGAEIFATAGSDEKRVFLTELGIEHVMDSRSLAFADQVLERTAEHGVDVILNSLAGQAIPRGIDALAEDGRFLEIGKRDIYDNMRLGLRPFRNNLSFFGIDLDLIMRNRPEKLGRLLSGLMKEFEQGVLRPLPHRVYRVSEIIDAFRFMQQGKHIGKIVISMQEAPRAIERGEGEPLAFREDASYLITGGFGGFGLAVARWMVGHGAQNLVLMGRRGIHSPDAEHAVEELKSYGARVVVVQGDVTKEEDVAAALSQIATSLPPLSGVFHAAMVLEDGLLLNLDRDWMRRVTAPKVEGGWNLHRLTLDCPLDHFVLFSSLSSVFGHAGQGNYAAANAFLDLLAHHRRASGLPCLSVNWGYLGEVGYLAERQQLGERLERQGVLSFTVRQALAALERAMQEEATQISVMNVDWSRWRGLGVTGKVSPRFRHLLKDSPIIAESGGGVPSLEALRAMPAADRPELVDRLLHDKISSVLGVETDQLDGETPLLDLGLDSLMAVELRNWIETALQVNLPIVQLMRSPSLTRATEILCEELAKANEDVSGDLQESTRDVKPQELLARIDEMSGQEVEDLLQTLLDGKGNVTLDPGGLTTDHTAY